MLGWCRDWLGSSGDVACYRFHASFDSCSLFSLLLLDVLECSADKALLDIGQTGSFDHLQPHRPRCRFARRCTRTRCQQRLDDRMESEHLSILVRYHSLSLPLSLSKPLPLKTFPSKSETSTDDLHFFLREQCPRCLRL